MRFIEANLACFCAYPLAFLCLVGFALAPSLQYLFSASGFFLIGYSLKPSSHNSAAHLESIPQQEKDPHVAVIMQCVGLICLGAGQVSIVW